MQFNRLKTQQHVLFLHLAWQNWSLLTSEIVKNRTHGVFLWLHHLNDEYKSIKVFLFHSIESFFSLYT